jgi:hypothetical protein
MAAHKKGSHFFVKLRTHKLELRLMNRPNGIASRRVFIYAPGLSLYPEVKIAAKNATMTNRIKNKLMLCKSPFVNTHIVIL